MTNNSIMTLMPYKWNGQWVFDDEATGLVREAFVAGADTILDTLTSHIPSAESGFILTFSGTWFPESRVATKVDPEGGGVWYRFEDGQYGWLCPALFKYFPVAPDAIYLSARPAGPQEGARTPERKSSTPSIYAENYAKAKERGKEQASPA